MIPIILRVHLYIGANESDIVFRRFNYRPQRSCGQGYVFTGVCDSVHRGGSAENPPPTRQTPPGTKENPPGPGRPPPEEDCSIRSMSGRYASYWNAILLRIRLILILNSDKDQRKKSPSRSLLFSVNEP